MSFSVIIPARYQSVRLPGKPLLDLGGKPMIQHVYEQASASNAERVIVATDDERIAEAVEGFGGRARMTAPDHPSGTDRLQEAARLEGLSDEDVVVNVQGDEPLIPPEVINQVADNLLANDVPMATLTEPIDNPEDIFDTNIVKVVSNEHQLAVYFSRAPIPWARDEFAGERKSLPAGFTWQRHLGIYAYRVSLLNDFVKWGSADIESIEKLEQLRVLWRGIGIHVAQAMKSIPPGIDTEEDVQKVLALLNRLKEG